MGRSSFPLTRHIAVLIICVVGLARAPTWKSMQMHVPLEMRGRASYADIFARKLYKNDSQSRPYSRILAQEERDPLEGGVTEGSFKGLGQALHLQRFTRVSSYRWDARTFIFVGMTTLPLPVPQPEKMPFQRCWWQPFDDWKAVLYDSAKQVEGNATLVEVPDHHFMLYRGVNIRCTFETDVGQSEEGGFIIYQPAVKLCAACPDWPSEQIILHEEGPRSFLKQLDAAPQHESAICSPPLHTKHSVNALREWIEYHDALFSRLGPGDEGFTGRRTPPHFFIYTVGSNPDIEAMLKPFVDDGRVSVVDWTAAQEYPGWEHNLGTQMNDCALRSKGKANFTYFFDAEKYLYLQPPYGVKDLVRILEANGSVTLGHWQWKGDICTKLDDDDDGGGLPWMLEYFAAPSKGPTGGDTAVTWMGRRRWAINNRALFQWVATYEVQPDEGATVCLNASEIGYFNEFGTITWFSKDWRCGFSQPLGDYGKAPFTNVTSRARAFARALRVASKSLLLTTDVAVNR